MCFMAFENQAKVNSNFDDDDGFMIEYEEFSRTSTSLMKRIPHLRKRFLSFKRNLMK